MLNVVICVLSGIIVSAIIATIIANVIVKEEK